MVYIKVCGITNLEDAFLVAELGANAIGFVFAPSSRKVEPEIAQEIIRKLPPSIDKVGVFVNEDETKVKEIASFCFLNSLQFHGEEDPIYCLNFAPNFKGKIIKAFRIKEYDSLKSILEKVKEFQVDAYLLDTYDKEVYGGTGKTFNWDIAVEVKRLGKPVILSGGLNPQNITEAIEKVKPYGVDVSSGVETFPGKKDPDKLRAFIKACLQTSSEEDLKPRT